MSASSRNGLLALCGSFMTLSSVTVGLRFYSRRYQRLPHGLDDWTALFGVITYIGACALCIELVVLKSYPYGNNSLTSAQVAERTKPTHLMLIAYDFLFMNTLACAKLSALFMYRRLFSVQRRGHLNVIILTTVAIVIAWYIAFDVLSCLQCRLHFSAFWDGTWERYCDLNHAWAWGLALSDFFLDLWVFLLPVPTIWSLNISTTKKFSLVGVFLLALVGIGASVARIVIFFEAVVPSAPTLYIGILESGMIITVINLPSIWYICTSVIVKKLDHGLNSLNRLRNTKNSSIGQRPSTNSFETATNISKGASTIIQPIEAWELNDLSETPDHHVEREMWRDTGKDIALGLRPNTIHVQNDVEVKHDQL